MSENSAPPVARPFFRGEWCDGVPVATGQAVWESAPPLADSGIGTLRGAWCWDGETLTAEVDTFGFHTLFYHEKDGVVMVSPSLLELVAQGADCTPDSRALAVFHRMGIFIHDDTPLRHVRSLPPGGRLIWSNGKLHVSGHTDMPVAQQISREDAVEGMITLFRDAMRRTLAGWDGALTLPLSGGRDSRHILLELRHQGRPPDVCVTFHHNGAHMNPEALAARALCVRTGARHDVLGHARPRLADALRALVMTGLCADEHAQMMPLHDYFLGRAGAGFDGIAGDILTNPDNDAERFFRLAEKGDYRAIARGMIEGHGRVISQHGSGGAGALWSPGRDDEVAEYVGAAIAAYGDAPDPYQMFWFYHRTRREINFVPQAILSPAKIVFCPYLDETFARFCLSLPYHVTCDQQLHNDAIARAYPDCADIPYAEGFSAPPAAAGSWGHKARSLGDVWRIAGALAPTRRMRAACDFLRPRSHLRRGPDAIYRLHAMCLDGLDAARARMLLELADELEAARPHALVSDAI